MHIYSLERIRFVAVSLRFLGFLPVTWMPFVLPGRRFHPLQSSFSAYHPVPLFPERQVASGHEKYGCMADRDMLDALIQRFQRKRVLNEHRPFILALVRV